MLKRKWQQTQSMYLPKRILNTPTQESVDHVWRILPDPLVLFGLACWQEEDRYGLEHDIVWICFFLSSLIIYQTAFLVKKAFLECIVNVIRRCYLLNS